MLTHPRATSRISTVSALVYVWTHHTSILHLLDTLLREYNGILTSKNNVILSRIIFMLSYPLLLKLFESLLVLRFHLINPLSRRKLKQESAMISQASHHIFLFLDLASEVNNL